MRKILVLSVLSTFALASAQQALKTSYGQMNLVGCFPDQGRVRCDFLLENPGGFRGIFDASDFKYATADGQIASAQSAKLMNNDWSTGYTGSASVLAGLPVKISVRYDLKPSGVIPYLLYNDSKIQNVPIQGTTPAPATVKPAGNAVVVEASGFTIDLSGCTKVGNDYKCTSATLKAKN